MAGISRCVGRESVCAYVIEQKYRIKYQHCMVTIINKWEVESGYFTLVSGRLLVSFHTQQQHKNISPLMGYAVARRQHAGDVSGVWSAPGGSRHKGSAGLQQI